MKIRIVRAARLARSATASERNPTNGFEGCGARGPASPRPGCYRVKVVASSELLLDSGGDWEGVAEREEPQESEVRPDRFERSVGNGSSRNLIVGPRYAGFDLDASARIPSSDRRGLE